MELLCLGESASSLVELQMSEDSEEVFAAEACTLPAANKRQVTFVAPGSH